MAVAYLKFEDAGQGEVTVTGGLEDSAFDNDSAAHVLVLRLSQNVDVLSQMLAALPPVKIEGALPPVDEADDEPAIAHV